MNVVRTLAMVTELILRRLLVTTSADQTARVWRTTDFSEVQVLQHEAKRWVWDAAFSADSQYIFTGRNLFSCCFTPTFSACTCNINVIILLNIASSDGVARLWNVSAGTVEREYQGHQKAVTALAFRDEVLSAS